MGALGGKGGSDLEKQPKVFVTQWFEEVKRHIQSNTDSDLFVQEV